MRSRQMMIFFVLLVTLTGVYYANRGLQRVIRPRESAGRMFLFIFANFLLIIVTLVSMMALIVKLIPYI